MTDQERGGATVDADVSVEAERRALLPVIEERAQGGYQPRLWEIRMVVSEVQSLKAQLAERDAQIARLEEGLQQAEFEQGFANVWHQNEFLRGQVEARRGALGEMLESFTEPEDDNDIIRRARAALDQAQQHRCNCGAEGTAEEIADHIRRMKELPHNQDGGYHGLAQHQEQSDASD